MGKMALILVLSLTVSAAIVGYSINMSKSRTVENVTGFQKYTTARNIAHTGVNMMLRTLDKNDTNIVNPLWAGQKIWLVKNIMSGLCSVSIQLKNPAFHDTVDLTSKSKFMDTVKSMTLRLRRQPVPFPTVHQAVGLHVDSVNFDMTGSARIDGYNHDVDGNLLPHSADDLPGVGVIRNSDTTKVLADASKIDGTRDVVVDTTMSDPSQFVDEYIDGADLTFVGPTTIGGSQIWGTKEAPWIVYCDGTAGVVKFDGNIYGWGILVVKGNLNFTGTFQFHGLMIASNDVQVDISFTTGTPNIIGGVLMSGAARSDYFMKGDSKVSYSKDALELAKYINKLQVYRVMRWYE